MQKKSNVMLKGMLAKLSALNSGNSDNYELVTSKGILPQQINRITEQRNVEQYGLRIILSKYKTVQNSKKSEKGRGFLKCNN